MLFLPVNFFSWDYVTGIILSLFRMHSTTVQITSIIHFFYFRIKFIDKRIFLDIVNLCYIGCTKSWAKGFRFFLYFKAEEINHKMCGSMVSIHVTQTKINNLLKFDNCLEFYWKFIKIFWNLKTIIIKIKVTILKRKSNISIEKVQQYYLKS